MLAFPGFPGFGLRPPSDLGISPLSGFGIWPLAAVFLVPLWWALDRLRERGAARLALAGLLFGGTAHAGGHLWLFSLVEVFLAGDAALGALLWLAHAVWFALGYGLYALLFGLLRRRGVSLAAAGLAPWLLLEWLQPQIFPVYAGSALAGVVPLLQIADLAGPLGLSGFVLVFDVAAYATLEWRLGRARRPLLAWGIALASLLLVLGYGALRIASLERQLATLPELRVGLVQPNLPVAGAERTPARAHAAHVELSRALLAETSLDLLVWGESAERRAIRGPLPVSGRFVREDLDVPLLFGGTLVQSEDGRREKANAAFLVGDDDTIRDAYEKILLIPLAEWIPFGGLVPGLAERLPHAQAFAAGREPRALVLGDVRIATPICYEAIRPGFVRKLVTATDAALIVTLANDAWFGDSRAPRMHLALASLRAVEHRRYLVRATNSGMSAFVDPLGRIVQATAPMSRATLHGTVHPLEGRTLYGMLGDWPGWLAAAVVVAISVRSRRAASTASPSQI